MMLIGSFWAVLGIAAVLGLGIMLAFMLREHSPHVEASGYKDVKRGERKEPLSQVEEREKR